MDGKGTGVERAYEKVIMYIKGEIWRKNLKRGDLLPPERDLAQQLGVSRNSVREALRTMSLMGFVSSVQGAGNYLSCDLEQNLSKSLELMFLLGETNYRQISQLRWGMESETARLAAGRILPWQAAKLSELARQMREEPDPQKGAKLDQQFHFLLCDAAENKLIRALFGALLSTVNEFIKTMYGNIVRSKKNAAALQDTHQEIADALAAHDADAAIRAIWKHFEVVDEAIEQIPQGVGQA